MKRENSIVLSPSMRSVQLEQGAVWFRKPVLLKVEQKAYGFPGGSVAKNLPANAGEAGSIPGLGRSLEQEMATCSSNLAWKIPWTEEPGRLQPMGSQKSWT